MKKALSFAVALGLVGGMASTAMAVHQPVNFASEARIRAINQNIEMGATETKDQEYDVRFRFTMNAEVADTVMVKTRMTMLDTYLGDGGATGGGSNVILDRAWIEIKDQAGTGGTWSYGRMPANWSKFFSYGNTRDRVKAVYKTDAGVVGGFIQKSAELQLASGDGDNDAYSLFYLGKSGDTSFKGIVVLTDNDTTGDAGHVADLNVATKVGGATVELDLASKDNDAWADAQLGFMANAKMALGDGLTGNLTFAYAKDGFTSDDDFHPTLLIGTSQVTAIANFGGDADTDYLVAAGAEMKLDDAASIVATLAYGDSDAADSDLTELDLTYKRNLTKGTNFALMASYAETGGVVDTEITTLAWQITTKW